MSRKWPHDSTVDKCTGTGNSSEDPSQQCSEVSSLPSSSGEPPPPHSKKQQLSSSEKIRQYKAKLSYKREWEKKYPWVTCQDASKGMFCTVCTKWGHPSAGSRGAWISKGISDWSHATEVLKLHGESQYHQYAAVSASMSQQAERGKSVLELQCSAAAKQAASRVEKNRSIMVKLMRSVYFLAKNMIPHTTVYTNLIALQVANGDGLLEEHITQGASNTQYTSKYSVVMLLEALNTWLERKQLQSLQSSPYFSILADECQDIHTGRAFRLLQVDYGWLSTRAFLGILHVKAVDAASITKALTPFIEKKHLDYRRLVGQGYDGAATFSGCMNGVQRRIRHTQLMQCISTVFATGCSWHQFKQQSLLMQSRKCLAQ